MVGCHAVARRAFFGSPSGFYDDELALHNAAHFSDHPFGASAQQCSPMYPCLINSWTRCFSTRLLKALLDKDSAPGVRERGEGMPTSQMARIFFRMFAPAV
jgi:hypothetical protein